MGLKTVKTHFLQNFHELRGYIEAKQAENDGLGRIVEQINERAKKKKKLEETSLLCGRRANDLA